MERNPICDPCNKSQRYTILHTQQEINKTNIQGCIYKIELQLHACLQGLFFFSKFFSILHELFSRFSPLIILPSLDLCWTHFITYSMSSPYFSVSPSFNSHPILFYSILPIFPFLHPLIITLLFFMVCVFSLTFR